MGTTAEPTRLPDVSDRSSGAGTLEETLKLHRESHVARDLELPAHESHLAVQLPHDHVDVVLRRHGERHVRRGRGALLDVRLAVLDCNVPLAAIVATQVELDGRVHTFRGVRVEVGRHLVKDLLWDHCELLLLAKGGWVTACLVGHAGGHCQVTEGYSTRSTRCSRHMG